MDIYLIRHGKTIEDSMGFLQSSESQLSEKGIAAAKILRKKLRGIKFTKIYCSPQIRAVQTAKEVFGSQKIETLDFIHEYIRPRSLEGKTKEEAYNFWENKNKSAKYGLDWKVDGSESFKDIVMRVDALIKLLGDQQVESQIAVVGHGVFFRHFLGKFLLGDDYTPVIFFNFLRSLQLGNCGYIKIFWEQNTKHKNLLELYYPQ
ncbi:phosphoglycerate mutase family protein [Patescibacteria group bacterium]|nr:phosphoglycerate mutase family protein [Patescibacteria group bacterium]